MRRKQSNSSSAPQERYSYLRSVIYLVAPLITSPIFIISSRYRKPSSEGEPSNLRQSEETNDGRSFKHLVISSTTQAFHHKSSRPPDHALLRPSLLRRNRPLHLPGRFAVSLFLPSLLSLPFLGTSLFLSPASTSVTAVREV